MSFGAHLSGEAETWKRSWGLDQKHAVEFVEVKVSSKVGNRVELKS
jgi:hypothetical protein